MQLFGKQGAAMIPFLNKGSAGIAELEAKAKSMGLTLDDTSIKIMAAGKVSARNFAASIQGMKVQLGQDLAPMFESVENISRAALTPIITGFTHLFEHARGPMMKFAGELEKASEKTGEKVTAVLGKVGSVFRAFGAGMKSPVLNLAGVTGPLRGLEVAGHAARAEFIQIKAGLNLAVYAFKTGGENIKGSGLAGSLESVGLFFRQVWDAIKPLWPQLKQLYLALSPVHLVMTALMPVLPQLGAAFGLIARSIGGALPGILRALVPVVTQVAMVLGGLVVQAVRLVPPIVQLAVSLIPPLLRVFNSLVPVLLQIITQGVSPLIQALGVMLPPIIRIVVQLVAALVPVFLSVVGAVLGVVRALLPLIPIVLQLVSTVLPPLLSVFQAVIPILISIINLAIVPLAQFLGVVLVGAINALMPIVTIVFTFIANSIKNAMTVVQGIINVVMGLISGNWSQVWQGIQGIAGGIWAQIQNIVSGAVGIIGSLIGSALRIVGDMPGQIGSFFAGAGQWLWNAGVNVVQGLMNGIQSLAGTIGNFFLSLLPGWIVDPFKAALGIHSPSRVFHAFGGFIGQGLIDGLQGHAAKIKSTTQALAKGVAAAFDHKEISSRARNGLLGMIADDNAALVRLANQRDALAGRISAASKAFTAAVNTRASYAATVAGKVDGVDPTQTSDLAGDLQEQISRAGQFAQVLTKLRGYGLNTSTYKQLAGAGPAALEAAQALAETGRAGVLKIDKLQGQLAAAAQQLGRTAAGNLYDAGVNTAHGLLAGLQSQHAAIMAHMGKISASMTGTIRKNLGIRSPSTVFHEVGGFIGQGLVNGLASMAPAINHRISTLVPHTVQAPAVTGPHGGQYRGAGAGSRAGVRATGHGLNIEHLEVHEAQGGSWQTVGQSIMAAAQVQAPRAFV
jgi:phage-related protein